MAAEQLRASPWQYYFNPWWTERHTYFSKLTSDECRRLINESTTPFLGRIRRALFSSADFTLHRMSFFRNSFRPYAYVNLTDAVSSGTLVAVTLSAARSVQLFFIFWFGFLGFWTALATWSVLQRGPFDFLVPLFGLGMATFGFLLNVFGRALAADDAAFLISFLRDELGLQQPPPSAISIA